MKRKIVIISVIFVLLLAFFFDFSTHFTRVSAGKVEPVPYLMLKWGNGENEVGLSGPYEDFWYDGPATFDVDKKGNVYIVDPYNKRILKVNKRGEVLESVSIEKIMFKSEYRTPPFENLVDLLPVKLIVTNKCMFLLHHYAGGTKSPTLGDMDSEYVSIIKGNDIKIIDVKKLLGYPIDVYMYRLNGNKVVLIPDIPPEDEPIWKRPKGVIVNENGETRIVKELVNGSFDGITPFASLLYDEDKDTSLYRNVRIQVKDPQRNKVVFNSHLVENGAPIDIYGGLNFNGNKGAIMYHTLNSYDEQNHSMTTHYLIFTLSPRKEEHYIKVARREDAKDILPPPFVFTVTWTLGEDGHFYEMLYKKDGLLISRFEPEVSTTTYQYRFIKFTKHFSKN